MFNFGESNFVNCYVTLEGRHLLVHVRDTTETEDPYHSKYYKCTMLIDGKHYLVFNLPSKWKHTFEMFLMGQYSQFTKAAKAMIIQYSGLNWKQPTDKSHVKLSDARLLAMYKGAALRTLLSHELGTEIYEDSELISPPKPDEFMAMVFFE
jgi:hypothetical protein